MADENRTVTVSLQLLYDPRSGRAFQQMAQEAEKAASAVNKKISTEFQKAQKANLEKAGIASNFGAFGFANRVGRVNSMATGAEAMGFGGAGKFLNRAAVPLALAGGAANVAEKVAGYAYDRYSTDNQIGRAAFRDLVPFGERIQKFADAMSGRAAGMEQANITAQERGAAAQARNEKLAFGLQMNPRIAAAQGTAEAFRRQTAVAPGVYNRMTSEGERQYREEQRILPLKQAEAKAERDMASASKERMAYQKELVTIGDRTTALTKERAKLESQLLKDENQSGVGRQNVLKDIGRVNEELGTALGLQKTARLNITDAMQKEAGAGGEYNKAKLRTRLLGQAETLEGRVETAMGAGERLGAMNPYDRSYGLYAAKLIKDRGSTDGLPDDLVQAGMSFAPEYVRSIVRKTGAATSEFGEGFKEFGAADFGTTDMAGDSQKAQELRRQLAEGEFKIDADTSNRILRSFENVGKDIADLIDRGLDKMKNEILNNVRLGRNDRS